jgi:hypothetical protein
MRNGPPPLWTYVAVLVASALVIFSYGRGSAGTTSDPWLLLLALLVIGVQVGGRFFVEARIKSQRAAARKRA